MKNTTMEFNVLFVTRRFEDEWKDRNEHKEFHRLADGKAAVVAGVFDLQDQANQKARLLVNPIVCYDGREGKLLWIRPGLNGTAVTLAMKVEDSPYDVWELYTDTPTEGHTREELAEVRKAICFLPHMRYR